MKKTKNLALISAAAVILSCMAMPVSAEYYDSISLKEITVPEAGENTGLFMSEGRMFRVTDEGVIPFTGKTKNEKGTRCFVNGAVYFGWKQMNGKWYYFDPVNGGYMASLVARTSLGSYGLDEDGAWNGKVSSKAKAPENFSLSYTSKEPASRNYSEFYISAKNDTISSHITKVSVTPDFEGTYDIKVPAADRQIIYDMLMSCKLREIDTKSLSAEDEGAAQFGIRFANADGSETNITGTEKMYESYDSSTDVQHAAYFISFIRNYITSMDDYQKITDKINDPAPAEKSTVPEADVLKELKETDSRIYKTSGEGLKISKLLTSEDETWDFTQDILAPAYGKNRKFITFLINFEQSFFEDHVIYVESYNSATGSRQFRFEGAQKIASETEDGADIRVIYTSDVPETYTDDIADYILITILDRDEAGSFNNISNAYQE